MPARALIIAIEDYPQAQALDRLLPGTNAGAEAFRDWLIQKKGVKQEHILACAGAECPWRTTGGSRKEIVDTLLGMAKKWQEENNEELYFYFSGHGFSHETQTERIEIDVLVAAEFIDPENSGDACLQFQEIQKKLVMALGPGNHYYFIDACRNTISREQITVPVMGKQFPVAARGRSKYYTLYSTAIGQVARVQSGFTQRLLEGLNGAGTAKKWAKGELYVTFEHLRDYVKEKLRNQEVEAQIGADGDGLIVKIDPIPQYDCDVTVVNGVETDSFTLTVRHELIGDLPFAFTGRTIKVKLKPFDYFLRVTHPSSPVLQIVPASGAVSVYDAAVAEFKKQPSPSATEELPEAPIIPPKTKVKLTAGTSTQIHLSNDESGATFDSSSGVLVKDLAPGRYVAHVVENGIRIGRRNLIVEPGAQPLEIDLLERPQTPLREQIHKDFSHSGTSRYAAFSESLGDLANPDLCLWLSIFGASHIVRDPREFRMMQKLQLDRFDDLQAGDCVIYVLFGSERKSRTLKMAVSGDMNVRWQAPKSVDTLVGVYERRVHASEGLHLLSLQIADRSPVSLPVYCLPNRVTFIAVAEEADGEVRLRQFILPVRTLFQYLDPQVREYVYDRPLKVVKTIALAQTRFARNQTLTPTDSQEESDWQALFDGKWLDPIMSLIAGYDILRTGRVQEQRGALETVLRNLTTYFPGLPDTEIIARQIGLTTSVPRKAPLFTDGLLMLEDIEAWLPLPASRLDFSSPWTLWRGAVRRDSGI
jgi:hypothetical protein